MSGSFLLPLRGGMKYSLPGFSRARCSVNSTKASLSALETVTSSFLDALPQLPQTSLIFIATP